MWKLLRGASSPELCMTTPKRFILALGISGSAFTGHADIILDDFSVPTGFAQTVTRANLGTSVSTLGGLSSPSVIGSSRALSLRVTGTSFFARDLASAAVNSAFDDQLVYANAGIVNSFLQLSYDNAGAGLGADFSQEGQLILDLDATGSNGSLTAEFFSEAGYAGGSATRMVSVPNGLASPTPLSLLFSSFVLTGGFSWGDVDSIRFTLDGPPGYDITLGGIATQPIPEASAVIPTLGLLTGMAYLAFRRRRAHLPG